MRLIPTYDVLSLKPYGRIPGLHFVGSFGVHLS